MIGADYWKLSVIDFGLQAYKRLSNIQSILHVKCTINFYMNIYVFCIELKSEYAKVFIEHSLCLYTYISGRLTERL